MRIKRVLRTASFDYGRSLVQAHAHLARDRSLGGFDERIQREAERRVPQAVIDELGVRWLDAAFERPERTFQSQVFEVTVSRDQRQCTGDLVDLAALDADEPVFDHVDPS